MWFDIIKNYEDIPDEYIQEGIQAFVETELGDSICLLYTSPSPRD